MNLKIIPLALYELLQKRKAEREIAAKPAYHGRSKMRARTGQPRIWPVKIRRHLSPNARASMKQRGLA